MSEATMSREDEIRERYQWIRSQAEDAFYAGLKRLAREIIQRKDDIDYLMSEVARLRMENEELRKGKP